MCPDGAGGIWWRERTLFVLYTRLFRFLRRSLLFFRMLVFTMFISGGPLWPASRIDLAARFVRACRILCIPALHNPDIAEISIRSRYSHPLMTKSIGPGVQRRILSLLLLRSFIYST